MSVHSKVAQWQNAGRFCVERATDYSDLLGIGIEQTRKSVVRELSALVALTVAGLFSLSFACLAIIATAWGTPYFLQVVSGCCRVVAAGLVCFHVHRSFPETRPVAPCPSDGDPQRSRHLERGAQMTRTPGDREIETAILTRMADSRATLLAANRTSSAIPAIRKQWRLPANSLIGALADAPHVALLLALCVGAIVIGPRRTIGIVGRSGVTALLKSAPRKVLLDAK